MHFWRVQGQLYLHLTVDYLKTPSVATENYIASNRISFDTEIRNRMEEIVAAIRRTSPDFSEVTGGSTKNWEIIPVYRLRF